MMTASNIHYEIAERARATAAGGIGAMHLLVRKLGLERAIDRRLELLKIDLPYHESDHVLSIAYNLLVGGTCLEHLELLRSDEAYLDALGARRIPDGVRFLFGIDATPTLYEIAEKLPKSAWKELRRRPKYEVQTEPRQRPANVKQEIVQQRRFEDKGGVRSLSAPVDNLVSNWAYMVMASLAWSLKAWSALGLPEEGRWQERHGEEKRKLLRMDFATFRQAMMDVPAQIVRSGRKML